MDIIPLDILRIKGSSILWIILADSHSNGKGNIYSILPLPLEWRIGQNNPQNRRTLNTQDVYLLKIPRI
jgi:hypothetical protein